VIQRRLDAATREIENYGKYDYILVNDRLDESVKGLEAIVLSERLRRSGQANQSLSARAEIYRLENVRERLHPILQSFREVAASGGK
jgi:guanylate kinase